MAAVAKALGDPIRLQLVDVLRKHAGKVCVCELVPLFDLSQPTVSHHLKMLRDAGIVGSERAGCGPTTTSMPEALEELSRVAELERGAATEARVLLARGAGDCCEPEPRRPSAASRSVELRLRCRQRRRRGDPRASAAASADRERRPMSRTRRDPAQRPADALPPLGGLAVDPVRDRPRAPTASSGARWAARTAA